ncbi:hypothetical protein DY000_02041672 [Brassica cretica]|uniref:Auxin-responsive protein n=1 Tax=Brassica cretica TaxID=69181 RepID=A0ABQ7BA07_BRACR|nr:hypothetical protein DY000_02041672 [Brassica cretica]
MDGAPYLRKADLKSYTNYMELSTALEKMFTTFTLGQCGSNKATRKDKLCQCGSNKATRKDKLYETKLKDLLNGKDSVLSYEDKDGDWMLVGDVPWEMFIDVCKKKIMKGCDAIGLGKFFFTWFPKYNSNLHCSSESNVEKSKMRAPRLERK